MFCNKNAALCRPFRARATLYIVSYIVSPATRLSLSAHRAARPLSQFARAQNFYPHTRPKKGICPSSAEYCKKRCGRTQKLARGRKLRHRLTPFRQEGKRAKTDSAAAAKCPSQKERRIKTGGAAAHKNSPEGANCAFGPPSAGREARKTARFPSFFMIKRRLRKLKTFGGACQLIDILFRKLFLFKSYPLYAAPLSPQRAKTRKIPAQAVTCSPFPFLFCARNAQTRRKGTPPRQRAGCPRRGAGRKTPLPPSRRIPARLRD